MRPLTERDIETLGELCAASDSFIKLYEPYKAANADDIAKSNGWVMPMDCGGGNGSHHSQTLTKLAKRGLCERKKYGGAHEKGSCRYRINDAGRAFLQQQKESSK